MTTRRQATFLALCLLAGSAADARQAAGQAKPDHVAIHVADAEASARFDEGVFGFVALKTPFPAGSDVVRLDIGGGIALHVFGGRKTPLANEHERHIAVTVPDITSVTTYLRSRGTAWQDFDGVSGRMQTRPDGVHRRRA